MRQLRASLTLVLAFLLTLPFAGVAGADQRGQAEERRPDNPGEQAEERRQDNNARATQAAEAPPEEPGRSADAPHGRSETAPHGHGDDPVGAQAQDEAETADEENIPAGNKGTVKVRSHGADSHPPRTEPHVDCIFDVLFYGFASSGATATLATQAPTSPTGQQVGPVQSTSWEPANRPGSEYVGRVTFDLRGVIDNGDFTYHEQQGYHLKLTVTNDDREAPGNRKHKVFWVDCPPAPVPAPAAEVEAPDVTVLGALTEADEVAAIAVEEDEAVDVEVAGVLEERGVVAAAAGEAQPVAQVPVGALAATGIGALALLLLGLGGIGGGLGALRFGRK